MWTGNTGGGKTISPLDKNGSEIERIFVSMWSLEWTWGVIDGSVLLQLALNQEEPDAYVYSVTFPQVEELVHSQMSENLTTPSPD